MGSITYVALFSLAGATSFALAVVGWQYRGDPVGRWFAGLCAAAGLWSFADAAMLGAATFDRATLWYRAGWVSYELAVLFLLLFTLEYTGHERWVTRRRLVLFLAWPAATTLAVATNGVHHLVWSATHPATNGVARDVAVTPGPWFVADAAYSFGVAFLCLGLLIRRYLDARRVYRKQVAVLCAAVALPVVAAAVAHLAPSDVAVDPTSLSFTATSALFLWSIRRYRFLDTVPVAHGFVLEHVDDAVVVLGTGGEVVEFNAAAARLFDLSDADVGGAAESVLGADATDAVASGDGYAATVDGEARRFEVDAVEIRDGRGVERGTLLLFHDVTERHRREQWFRTLTENATDVTLVLDADAAVRYVGESVERAVGVAPAALDRERVLASVHDDDRGVVQSAFDDVLARPGETVEFECRVRDADGVYRAFDVRARNLLDDSVIEGVVVNAHDVTERKAHERRLERQNEQLDAFASVISHDLRNPLNVAAGYLDLLRDDPNPEYVDRIERAHERMEDIVSDVLALARSGSGVGEREAVDLRDAAEEAWANVATPGGTLVVADGATVEADRTRLLQLFENLFRNCVEHGSTDSRTKSGDAGDGGPTVRVGLLDDGTGFYVADDGPGVSPADREQVFESGFSTSQTGTGFGLSIVNAVAEAHGWEATCTESEGGGARFEFRGSVAPGSAAERA